MLEKDRLVKTSRLVVRTGVVVNRLFNGAVVLGLLLYWLFSTQLAKLLLDQNPGTDARSEMIGLRLVMLLGIAMAVAIDRLFVALKQIIWTARAGDPFIAYIIPRDRKLNQYHQGASKDCRLEPFAIKVTYPEA